LRDRQAGDEHTMAGTTAQVISAVSPLFATEVSHGAWCLADEIKKVKFL